MTHACQITEVSNQEFPEFIQFYHHYPKKYPFVLTTSGQTSFDSVTTSGTNNKKNQTQSNFDIIFIEPEEWLKLDHQQKLSASNSIDVQPDELFLDVLDRLYAKEQNADLISTYEHEHVAKNLPFTGGWFIFLAYELAQQIEPCLNLNFDSNLLPVAYAARVKKALIYDHQNDKLYFLSEYDVDHEESYQSLISDFETIKQSNLSEIHRSKFNQLLVEEDQKSFLNSVSTVKNYIKEGDVFQVNLSRLWQSDFQSVEHTELAFSLSHILSKENPAPFSGVAQFQNEKGPATIVSSSPERLLKVKHNRLESRPIAGTHPRSASQEEDSRLLKQLHAHPKEQAEHIMLIDLIRNDLGRVCLPGTVVVDELMVNESYAHVHHIVSNVSGELQANITPGDIIKAMFPGGTITGCPKVRCMEIIAELEQQSRGAYTGSMGYINLDGSMDLNILIRTMVLETILESALKTKTENPLLMNSNKDSAVTKKHKLSFRAGAGLVFDSVADNELQETRAKAKGLLRVLQSSVI